MNRNGWWKRENVLWGELLHSISEHANFLGKRYMKDNDPAVILIYDVNGYIAGIQAGVCYVFTEIKGWKHKKITMTTKCEIDLEMIVYFYDMCNRVYGCF